MPLADFQSAIGTLIATAATSSQQTPYPGFSGAALQLSEREAVWLQAVQQSKGFQVTCAIQRWWRETRLRDLARLTIKALGSVQAAAMINAYFQQQLCTSLFFLPETLAFLHYVAEHSSHPHHHSIALFERALLLAQEEIPSSDDCNPPTTLIEFAAPPEDLLRALMQGTELPAPTAKPYFVLISSGLPHFWQPVAAEELPLLAHLKTV